MIKGQVKSRGSNMKNVFFCLSILFLSSTALTQEIVPLFDEIPTFKTEANSDEKTTETSSSLFNIQNETPKIDSATKKPNLGRHAKPLKSLRLAPFPDVKVDLDPSLKAPVQNKKFEEKTIQESDILKRENPLSMTEKKLSDDDYLQQLINERRLSAASGKGYYKTPLGGRHDADGFLLASIALGMSTNEVEDILLDQGYHLSKIDETLPPALTIEYEKDCRLTRKLYVISDIKNCIFDRSKEEETRYIKNMTFERPATRETISVAFTSLATDNVAYRIFYQNKGDSSLNTSAKNMKIKTDRKNEFWHLVFSVYGLPDDSEKLIWGNENTSFLHAKMSGSAYDAYIVLESAYLQNEDYFKWEDSLSEMKKIRTFNFVSQEDLFEE